MVIETNGLTKYYGKFLAVDGVDLKIEKGEIFGFVGKNGAGKSTTIRMLLNMIFPSAGNAKINGMDCVLETKEIKAKVSYVPSEICFYDNMKVSEIISFSTKIHGFEKEKADLLCEYFELEQDKKLNELSLGNKKKVSLVLAFAKESELYILDEPTSGLDPLIQDKFFEKLLELKRQGKTIFLSSHNLNEIDKLCDRVAIIKDGKIVEIFKINELRSHSRQRIIYCTFDGENKDFMFDGDVNELIKELAKYRLKSLEIMPASLEDELKKYYSVEEKQ